MRSVIRRLVSFTTLPFLSLLIPLVALPVVARVGGVDGWASLTVGQAVGSYAAAVAFVGWNVLGTPMVAIETRDSERNLLYARSFYVRGIVLLMISPVAAAVAALLAPDSSRALAALFAVSSALGALGVAWYAVGTSSPGIIAVYDLLPRVVATMIAIPLVVLTSNIAIYAAALIGASILGVLGFHLRVFLRPVPPWPGWRAVRADVAGKRAAWSVEVTGNLYSSAPVPVASALAGADATASYASGDRLYRYSLYAVVAFGNALQGWVLEATGSSRRRRNLGAICAMTILGIAGGVLLAILGPAVTMWLFGADVAAEPPMMLWLGVAFLAIACSTPLIRNLLMPARRDRQVLATTLVSAIVGIVTMILATLEWGATGVAVGLAVSESLTLMVCAVLVWRVGLGSHRDDTVTRAPSESGAV